MQFISKFQSMTHKSFISNYAFSSRINTKQKLARLIISMKSYPRVISFKLFKEITEKKLYSENERERIWIKIHEEQFTYVEKLMVELYQKTILNQFKEDELNNLYESYNLIQNQMKIFVNQLADVFIKELKYGSSQSLYIEKQNILYDILGVECLLKEKMSEKNIEIAKKFVEIENNQFKTIYEEVKINTRIFSESLIMESESLTLPKE